MNTLILFLIILIACTIQAAPPRYSKPRYWVNIINHWDLGVARKEHGDNAYPCPIQQLEMRPVFNRVENSGTEDSGTREVYSNGKVKHMPPIDGESIIKKGYCENGKIICNPGYESICDEYKSQEQYQFYNRNIGILPDYIQDKINRYIQYPRIKYFIQDKLNLMFQTEDNRLVITKNEIQQLDIPITMVYSPGSSVNVWFVKWCKETFGLSLYIHWKQLDGDIWFQFDL